MTQVSPVPPNIQLSVHSLNSQEQLEAALRDLVLESNEKNGLCKGDAITDAGKRRQLLKMLGLTMTPLFVLLGVTFYFLAESAAERAEVNTITTAVGFSVELANCIHYLQLERDQNVLYLSNIGPETKYFLFQRYIETDQELNSLSRWPTNLDLEDRPQFKSLEAFQAYLTNHRNSLDLLSPTVYEEMDFYTKNIQIFILWLYNSITESRFGTIWKTLVAYQKIVSGKEEVGIERALGSAFFYRGGFDNHEIYLEYTKKTNTFAYSYRSAQNYSPIVRPIANLKIRNAGNNLTQNLKHYRDVIQHKNISYVSKKEATRYYDNMTMYIDILLEIQRSLADEILDKLDESSRDVIANIIISSVLIFVVLALCPLQIQAVYKQTSDIQSYALTLADKTRELNKEKRRTDSLLYQMLPRAVADQLKNRQDVTAEYFKHVTVFFSSIDGFSNLSSECSPMQIVELLKEMYRAFDGIIELYTVYKVETIGDQYMVASGLPTKNWKRHASEIADMALEFLETMCSMTPVNLSGKKIRLKIGIHSGPVMAGIVGSKLPRYCLFGDTVNTASRMESNGWPDKIHVSGSSYKLLSKHDDYIFECRGPIVIKGKGQMVTYWLSGRNCRSTYQGHMPNDSRNKSSANESHGSTGRDGGYVTSAKITEISMGNEMTSVSNEKDNHTSNVSAFRLSTETDTSDREKMSKASGPTVFTLPKSTSRPTLPDEPPVALKDLESGISQQFRCTVKQSFPPSYEELSAAWEKHGNDESPNPPMVEGYHY